MPTNQPTGKPLRAVRVDLSSMPVADDQPGYRQQIIQRLISAGANAVFINPWSDGYANYHSRLAPLSPLGQQQWLEQFITDAHRSNLQVFAWFVVGKDNFPASLHPDWHARTIKNQPYLQADEPGINLPFASLAHPDYLAYHLSVVKEANLLPVDGWVISEPLIGWGDRYDDFYTDFSPSALSVYQQQDIIQPNLLIQDVNQPNNQASLPLYQRFINARADIVTNFVAKTMQQLRAHDSKPIIITVFTEPDEHGQLKSLNDIKEWLGTDILQLAALQPDIIEIQSLFLDFEYPQTPQWTAAMIQQFKQQLPNQIPIAVSVQGFSGQQPLSAPQFITALSAAANESVASTSFYAYHTLTPEHWQQLTTLWKN